MDHGVFIDMFLVNELLRLRPSLLWPSWPIMWPSLFVAVIVEPQHKWAGYCLK